MDRRGFIKTSSLASGYFLIPGFLKPLENLLPIENQKNHSRLRSFSCPVRQGDPSRWRGQGGSKAQSEKLRQLRQEEIGTGFDERSGQTELLPGRKRRRGAGAQGLASPKARKGKRARHNRFPLRIVFEWKEEPGRRERPAKGKRGASPPLFLFFPLVPPVHPSSLPQSGKN